MKYLLISCFLLLLLFVFSSCETGYVKKNGNWSWVTNDVQFGSRSHWIDSIDMKSFKVVKANKNFGVDKNYAYFKGKKINHASSDGFQVLTRDEYGYAKNNHFVFLDTEVIVGADPLTFELLEFPYSRDKNDVYCGTLPLLLDKEEVAQFRVTNVDKLMKGMKSTTNLNHFLEFTPEYHWITTKHLEIEYVITGDWGTGETDTWRITGFKKEKK